MEQVGVWIWNIGIDGFIRRLVNPMDIISIQIIEQGFKPRLVDCSFVVARFDANSLNQLNLNVGVVNRNSHWKKHYPNFDLERFEQEQLGSPL